MTAASVSKVELKFSVLPLVPSFTKPGNIESSFRNARYRRRASTSLRISSSFDGDQNDEILLQNECRSGNLDRAIGILVAMQFAPCKDTYVCILRACIKEKALSHAMQVHSHIAMHHVRLEGFLGDYLVVTLAKCGAGEVAWKISRGLPQRTIFSWSAIIAAYVDCGRCSEALQLYQHMQEEKIKPNKYTLVSLAKACGNIPDLLQGKKIHEIASTKGYTKDPYLVSTLVSMYGKCGTITEAEEAFQMSSDHDIVSWTSMLSAYVDQGECEKALRLYRQMHEEGVDSKDLISVVTLQACGLLAEKEQIRQKPFNVTILELVECLHADACKKFHPLQLTVANTLVSVYGKCGMASRSENVFCRMLKRDIVSWNAMLSAYVDQSKAESALTLYQQMLSESLIPDKLTFVIALQACTVLADKEVGINGKSTKMVALEIVTALENDLSVCGFASDMLVGTTLLVAYSHCGEIIETVKVFNGLLQRNIVSWTAMLCAYVDQGEAEKALLFYRHMQNEDVTMDAVTFICVLQSCSITGSLDICEELHFNVITAGYDQLSTIQTTLVNTYGSCASIDAAQSTFDESLYPDVVSWSACIAGHASEGNSNESLYMFEKFKVTGNSPDDILVTSLLSACSYTGLISSGLEYFEFMIREYGISPNLKHYGIIIDLLGRAGDLKRIMNLLQKMPIEADMAIWLSILGACRMHGNINLAKNVFDRAVKLQPKLSATYVLMSNIYADAGMGKQVAEVEYLGQNQGALSDGWMQLD